MPRRFNTICELRRYTNETRDHKPHAALLYAEWRLCNYLVIFEMKLLLSDQDPSCSDSLLPAEMASLSLTPAAPNYSWWFLAVSSVSLQDASHGEGGQREAVDTAVTRADDHVLPASLPLALGGAARDGLEVDLREHTPPAHPQPALLRPPGLSHSVPTTSPSSLSAPSASLPALHLSSLFTPRRSFSCSFPPSLPSPLLPLPPSNSASPLPSPRRPR